MPEKMHPHFEKNDKTSSEKPREKFAAKKGLPKSAISREFNKPASKAALEVTRKLLAVQRGLLESATWEEIDEAGPLANREKK